MIFTIPGDPVHKVRHRSCIRHGKIHSYDSQSLTKNAVSWHLKLHLNKALNSKDPSIAKVANLLKDYASFDVKFEFHIAPPSSLSAINRSLLLWFGIPDKKPDIDNLVKFYLDAGNGILWPDDKKIVELKAAKIYAENPQTIIHVTGRNHMETNDQIRGILGVFSPTRYYEMLSDIKFLAAMESESSRSQNHKARDAAYILSKFADTYSDELHKIKKHFPGYWKDCISKELIEREGDK